MKIEFNDIILIINQINDATARGSPYYVEFVIKHSSGNFSYIANDLYFELNAIEEIKDYLIDFMNGDNVRIQLTDQSNYFNLIINKIENRLIINFNIKEYNPFGEDFVLSGNLDKIIS